MQIINYIRKYNVNKLNMYKYMACVNMFLSLCYCCCINLLFFPDNTDVVYSSL